MSQVSTIEALMEGLYDGVMTYGELERYGDFGIGTFDNLDGEMVGFDGIFYQVRTDGVAYEVSDNMTTPFAEVTFFDADLRQDLPEGLDYEQLREYVDGILPTVNIFHAIKVEVNLHHGAVFGRLPPSAFEQVVANIERAIATSRRPAEKANGELSFQMRHLKSATVSSILESPGRLLF